MKKIVLSIVFVFATVGFTNATNELEKSKPITVSCVYPDCWAAANTAERLHCGSVRCDFDYWDAVYSSCMGYE